jgi:hypothetical protein
MRSPLHALLFCLATAPLAAAQVPFVLPIDQAASNFNWSGTSSLGPILGNPSTAFQMAGQSALALVTTPGSFAITGLQFTGGDAYTVPDLHGRIPNPFPFLPPLATIDVLGLHLSVDSPSCTVSGLGAFTADITLTATAGTLVVTPLGGSQSSTPLAGSSSAPTPQSGTIVYAAGNLVLTIPINSQFNFVDPGTGASGSITVTGTLHADVRAPMISLCDPGQAGVPACPCANPPVGPGHGCDNSSLTGGAQLSGSGLASLSADSLHFDTSGEKPTATSILLQGTSTSAGVVFGQGVRCVGGTLKRLYQATAVGGAIHVPGPGDASVSARSAFLGDPLASGATRSYAVYYRDPTVLGGCPASSSFNVTQTGQVSWLP